MFDDGIRQRNLQSRVDTLYGKDRQANPFLDKNGNLFNKYINYQSVLNNPNVSTAAKRFISQATDFRRAWVQYKAQMLTHHKTAVRQETSIKTLHKAHNRRRRHKR